VNRRSLLRVVAGGTAASVLMRPAAYAQAPRALRYGMAPAEDSALGAYAFAKGFFANAGLDVTLVPFPSGGAITPALLGGALEFGVTNVGSMALAHVRGVPLELIAGGSLFTSASPSAHVVALKSGGIRSPKDLPGKTIAVSSLRELAHCSVLQWLDRNGVDSKSVNFIEMSLASALGALEAGHLDAVDLIEPLFTRSKAEVIDLGTPFSAVADGKPVQIFGTIATKAFVDANPDIVRRAEGALRQAAKWANDPRNHSEAAVIIAGFTKIDLASVNAYPRMRFAERLDASFVQPPIDMLAKYGFLSRDFAAAELFAAMPG
jgi:NitT/TauT family transport system substrate-binding protein